MEEKDKPVQTDPSVPQTSPEETVRETVANVVKEQKAIENPIAQALSQSGTEQGGNQTDVPSAQDSSKATTDPNEAVLRLIEGSTGRKFDKIEDAQKFIKNLNSFVGDQEIAKARESAKLYDALVSKFAEEKGQPVDDVKRFFADFLSESQQKNQTQQPKPQQSQTQSTTATSQVPQELEEIRNTVSELQDKTQRAELKAKYPLAAEVENDVMVIAKAKGIHPIEVFENSPLKALLEAKAEAESGKSPVVAPSNRSNFDAKKVQDAAQRVVTRGKESDKLDLIHEFKDALGL